MDEPDFMLPSDNLNSGHYVLSMDVQRHLTNTTPWTTSWNVPWNDRAYVESIISLRIALQDFALWWQTQTDWPISPRKRKSPMPGLWQTLCAACALQILLCLGLVYRPGQGGDGFGLEVQGSSVYTEEIQRFRDAIVNWLRWMAWDEWYELVGPESDDGLYAQTKSRWNTLIRAYLTWFQKDAELREKLNLPS